VQAFLKKPTTPHPVLTALQTIMETAGSNSSNSIFFFFPFFLPQQKNNFFGCCGRKIVF
jgi:hypothetical protein